MATKQSNIVTEAGTVIDQDGVIEQTALPEENTAVALASVSRSIEEIKDSVKLKKRVTLPLLKQRVGIANAIVFLTPLYLGQAIEKAKIKERPTMAMIYNIQDGRVYLFILSTVAKSELLKAYPSQSYVNAAFIIETSLAGEGKDYHLVDLAEIELPEGYKTPSGIEIPKGGEVIEN